MRVLSIPTHPEANLMTPDGFDRLQRERRELSVAGREQVAARLRTARLDSSDASENAELRDALDEHQRLEHRIAVIEERLAGARIADRPSADGVAGLGSRVRLRGRRGHTIEFTLVGAGEADLARERISISAPMGSAVHGRRAGESIEVQTPRRRLRFTIVSVTVDRSDEAGDERRAA
jgi:transcription elongation factor GreA